MIYDNFLFIYAWWPLIRMLIYKARYVRVIQLTICHPFSSLVDTYSVQCWDLLSWLFTTLLAQFLRYIQFNFDAFWA